MAKLPVILAPDPRLRVKCRPVGRVDDAVRALMDDMLETMYAAPGIGLSAPQVGDDRRVIVVDCSQGETPPTPYRLVDPEIVEASAERADFEEGCLSLPDHYGAVARATRIRVRYRDADNQVRELAADGLLAACIQHEVDHLDGVLFTDHLSPLRRNMILRKLKKAKRQQAASAA